MHELCDYCEVVKLQGAKALAVYADNWYEGTPAVTENAYGKGKAIYQACRDTGSLKTAVLGRIVEELGMEANVAGILPYGVTAHSRTDGETTYIFVENYLEQDVSVKLHAPMENMLTGEVTDTVTLGNYGFGIFKSL